MAIADTLVFLSPSPWGLLGRIRTLWLFTP